MSSIIEEEEEAADIEVCANCGIAEVDNIELEECDGCDLVKYCSDNCQENHREQHEEECSNRRLDEFHDRRLFTQPDGTHRGECPICFLPMPLDRSKYIFASCCSKYVCKGCIHTNMMSNTHDRVKAATAATCMFCRTSILDKEELRKRKIERIEANDPASLCYRGFECYEEGDYDEMLEYYTKAAELGDAEAHHKLGCLYREGEVVEKDEEKAIYHWEEAAIGGHPEARQNLAGVEAENGNMERAVKHFIIAAKLGQDKSMKMLLEVYKVGCITKEEYGSTLRTHQAAIDATKSSQREAAEKAGF